jgi:hypothetical protein
MRAQRITDKNTWSSVLMKPTELTDAFILRKLIVQFTLELEGLPKAPISYSVAVFAERSWFNKLSIWEP